MGLCKPNKVPALPWCAFTGDRRAPNYDSVAGPIMQQHILGGSHTHADAMGIWRLHGSSSVTSQLPTDTAEPAHSLGPAVSGPLISCGVTPVSSCLCQL